MRKGQMEKKTLPDDIVCEVSHLSYCQGQEILLKDISFSVKKGERFVLLGESGSGKSLLIDAVLGHISGTGQVHMNTGSHPVGVAYDTFSTFPLLKVKEVLNLLEALYKAPCDESLMHALRVDSILDKKFSVLSKGERKRLGVYAALFFKPQLIILDEPTDGMDPALRQVFWQILEQQECSVFLTTHLWEEAQAVHDRIAFIAEGHLLTEPQSSAMLLENIPFSGKVTLNQKAGAMEMFAPYTRLSFGEQTHIYFSDDDEKKAILELIEKASGSQRKISPFGYSLFSLDLIDSYEFLREKQNEY